MRPRSMARELVGTVREILGTCQSVGCTIDGDSAQEMLQKVRAGSRSPARTAGCRCGAALPGRRSSRTAQRGLAAAALARAGSATRLREQQQVLRALTRVWAAPDALLPQVADGEVEIPSK